MVVRAANHVKELTRSTTQIVGAGYVPPAPLSFIVAYNGPAQMETVLRCMRQAHTKGNIPWPHLNQEERYHQAGTALDGVFVLGRGFIKLDNTPTSLTIPEKERGIFIACDSSEGNLLMLFLALLDASLGMEYAMLNTSAYLRSYSLPITQRIIEP